MWEPNFFAISNVFTTFAKNIYFLQMSCLRVLLCILFPPLAVIDKGCGSVIIVMLLSSCGWIPGTIAALVILNGENDD